MTVAAGSAAWAERRPRVAVHRRRAATLAAMTSLAVLAAGCTASRPTPSLDDLEGQLVQAVDAMAPGFKDMATPLSRGAPARLTCAGGSFSQVTATATKAYAGDPDSEAYFLVPFENAMVRVRSLSPNWGADWDLGRRRAVEVVRTATYQRAQSFGDQAVDLRITISARVVDKTVVYALVGTTVCVPKTSG